MTRYDTPLSEMPVGSLSEGMRVVYRRKRISLTGEIRRVDHVQQTITIDWGSNYGPSTYDFGNTDHPALLNTLVEEEDYAEI